MDINQMPQALSRAVHQRLLNDQEFGGFVLERLWLLLSPQTEAVLQHSRVWYFGELQIAENWRIPALVVLFRGAALLAQERYWANAIETASHCKALTCCDRLQIMGSDTCLRVWFDYSSSQWQRQALLPPAHWHPEEG